MKLNIKRNKFIKVVDSIKTNNNLTFMICYKNVIKILKKKKVIT